MSWCRNVIYYRHTRRRLYLCSKKYKQKSRCGVSQTTNHTAVYTHKLLTRTQHTHRSQPTEFQMACHNCTTNKFHFVIIEHETGECRCTVCGVQINRQKVVNLLLKKRFECGICGIGYTTKRCAKKHTERTHRTGIFRCLICGLSYTRHARLAQHTKTTHPDISQNLPQMSDTASVKGEDVGGDMTTT